MFADLYPETLSEVTAGGRVGHRLGRFFIFHSPLKYACHMILHFVGAIAEVVSTLLIHFTSMRVECLHDLKQ